MISNNETQCELMNHNDLETQPENMEKTGSIAKAIQVNQFEIHYNGNSKYGSRPRVPQNAGREIIRDATHLETHDAQYQYRSFR